MFTRQVFLWTWSSVFFQMILCAEQRTCLSDEVTRIWGRRNYPIDSWQIFGVRTLGDFPNLNLSNDISELQPIQSGCQRLWGSYVDVCANTRKGCSPILPGCNRCRKNLYFDDRRLFHRVSQQSTESLRCEPTKVPNLKSKGYFTPQKPFSRKLIGADDRGFLHYICDQVRVLRWIWLPYPTILKMCMCSVSIAPSLMVQQPTI